MITTVGMDNPSNGDDAAITLSAFAFNADPKGDLFASVKV